MVLGAGHLAAGANDEEGEAKGQEHQHLFHDAAPVCSAQKPSGIRPDPKAAVSAMPVMSMKAKARIAAMFTVITPLQRCLELFGASATLWGCRSIKNKQTIAIAVKYPMRSAAIVISSPTVWNHAAGTGEKLCPTSQQRLGEKWNYSLAHKWPSVSSKLEKTKRRDASCEL